MRTVSTDQLSGKKYNRKTPHMIRMRNYLLNNVEKFSSANILISYFGVMLEFISKDFKYFDQADFYFNTHAVARKYPSYFKNGHEFKAQSKRFKGSELFGHKVDGTILRSDLYGCKILISFFNATK